MSPPAGSRHLGWSLGVGLTTLALMSACSGVQGLPPAAPPTLGGSAQPASSKPEANSTTEPATSAPAGAISVDMTGPPPKFVPADLVAPTGDLVFFLHNKSQGIHTLAIGRELHKALVSSSQVLHAQAAVFTVRGLQAGHYVIWCTIDGHAEEGMVGTLTVN
jgi:plastocyanin